ncbi:MAG TPA: hypothetical protein PK597_03175 [Oscillospiraceae bacterium]|nr:hypothetical protein [Oscillospiraceae bacterium]
MAFLDNLRENALRAARITGEKTKEVAAAAAEKSKEVAEIAKHNIAIAGLEDDIKQTYMELGKRYYAEKADAPETSFAELCAKIGACMGEITEHRARIAEIKAERDEEDEGDDVCCEETCTECGEETCCCADGDESCDCGCTQEKPAADEAPKE